MPFPVTEKGLNDFMYYMAYYYGSRYLVTGDLFTLNEDGEPVILFEGIDMSEIDTAIENIVRSF